MVYVFLAEGFEQLEALAPVDILRRAGFKVLTVGVGGREITSSHGVKIICDISTALIEDTDFEAIILPGGLPGTVNLEKDDTVQRFITLAEEKNAVIGAICAAPSILGHRGLLKGKTATCFTGYEKDLEGAFILEEKAVADGNIVTSWGAGASFEFSFKLLDVLTGDTQKSEELKAKMRF